MRTTTRARLAAIIAIALAATACGGGDDTSAPKPDPSDEATATPTEAEAGPRTVTVNVDGTMGDSNIAMLAYFPRAVTVRQGDTVDFSFQPGDPHSVTFGTLIDQAIADMAAGQEPTTMAKIPFAVNEAELSMNYAGALPCLSPEDPPTDGSACTPGEFSPFDGTYAFYNSGLLLPGDSFAVEIAADAAPGTYNYFCLLHGPDMSGSITIVEADASAPTADEVAVTATEEMKAASDATQGVLDAVAEGTHPGLDGVFPTEGNIVMAGGHSPQPVPVDVLNFGPDEIEISVGDSVTWNVVGFHTISFNAPQDATPPFVPGADGLPVVNELAFAPQGGAPGAPPPPAADDEAPATDGPAAAVVIDGGSWDGTGFFSTGALPSFPGGMFAYELTFETAGTYTYQCLIHPDMQGTVTVA